MMIRLAPRLASSLSRPNVQSPKRDIFSDEFLSIDVFANKRNKAVQELGNTDIPSLAASVDALDPGGLDDGLKSVKGAIYLAQDKESIAQTGELVKALLSKFQVGHAIWHILILVVAAQKRTEQWNRTFDF